MLGPTRTLPLMSWMTRLRLLGALLGLTVSAALVAAPTHAAPTHAGPSADVVLARACAGQAPIEATVLARGAACDLTGRLVVSGGASAVVPPQGQAVVSVGDSGSGAPQRLIVEHFDGVVRTRTTLPGDLDKARAPLPACQDKAYKLYPDAPRWKSRLRYSYNKTGQLAGFSTKAQLRAVKRAGRTVSSGRNDCGLDDKIDAYVGYLGTTSLKPGIRATKDGASCGAQDGKNVVGWGKLGGDSAGWTCFYYDGKGRIFTADILLEASDGLGVGVDPKCTDVLDLQSLLTHEFGHAYGLDHISEAHWNLTMPHLLPYCSKEDRTLGLGDYLGLKKLYGLR